MRRLLPVAALLALVGGTMGGVPLGAQASGNVLLVGPPGYPNAQYSTIQAAVDAAQTGDWILIAPGVYHEKGGSDPAAGVLITKPGIHLRGMSRGKVIVDGTNLPNSPDGSGSLRATAANLAAACPADPALQDMGPSGEGRNGIEAYKVSGVTVENMTACNFLSVGGENGNEFWWNAGDGSDQQIPVTAVGRYLTATSTYYGDGSAAAKYGLFTSNITEDPTYGPSLLDYTYSNNMADSAYYIGASPDNNITLRHGHAQNSALGYSGTNGSGRVILELTEWDHLRAGIVPNTLNNDDAPSPQTGRCPAGKHSNDSRVPRNICFIVRDNNVHDNNNPDTPGSGIAGEAPVGAGIELSGTQWDAVVGNTVTNNGSWGIVMHDFPDTGTYPSDLPAADDCRGGIGTSGACFYPSGKNIAAFNILSGNGRNRNLTNGDLLNEQTPTDLVTPGPNCFHDNTDNGGPATEYPPGLQTVPCPPGIGESAVSVAELLCASGIVPATTGLPVDCTGIPKFSYPAHDLSKCSQYAPGSVPTGDPVMGACILPLSVTLSRAAQQPRLNPCAGVPANAYCSTAATPAATTNSGVTATALRAVAAVVDRLRRVGPRLL